MGIRCESCLFDILRPLVDAFAFTSASFHSLVPSASSNSTSSKMAVVMDPVGATVPLLLLLLLVAEVVESVVGELSVLTGTTGVSVYSTWWYTEANQEHPVLVGKLLTVAVAGI